MTMDIDMTMTDDMQNTPNDSFPQKTGIGARLRSAREAMHLSEKDAAARMHLSMKYIVDMENENFRNGAPVTFMRGYLRSYARIVKLSDEEVNEAIEQLGMNAPTKSAPIPVLRTPTLDNNERYVRWGTYLIVLILVGLVVVWWSTHSREMIADMPSKPAASTAQAPAQPAPAQPVTAQPTAVQPGTAQPAGAQPIPADTTPAGQAVGQPAANPATPGIAPTNTNAIPATPVQPGVSNVTVPVPPPADTTNAHQLPVVAPGPQPMNPDGAAAIPTPKAQTNQSDDDSSDDDDEPAPKAKRHSDIIQHMQMNRPEPGLDNDNDYD